MILVLFIQGLFFFSENFIVFLAADVFNPPILLSGKNDRGQLGIGSNVNQNVPVAVLISGALNTKTIKYISAGFDNVVAVDSDGIAYSWGDNINGDAGQNSATSYFDAPGQVFATDYLVGQRIVMVSSGGSFTLALNNKGRVFGWGLNRDGIFFPFLFLF